MSSQKNRACMLAFLLLALSVVHFTDPSGKLTGTLGSVVAETESAAFAISGVIRSSTGLDPAPGTCPAATSRQVMLTFTRVSGIGALPAPVQPDTGNEPALAWKQAGFETGTVYRVTPSLEGFVFSPLHIDFDGEKGELNFTVYKGALSLSGRVIDFDGKPIDGVTLNFHREPVIPGPPTQQAGTPVQTDASGNWQKDLGCAVACDNIRRLIAVPSKTGMFFTPEFAQTCSSAANLNFVGRPIGVTGVSAASFNGQRVAPGSIIAAYGTNFATTTEVASTLPLPTSLAGATVKVKDAAGVERNAPLFFVSPTQINYQVPSETTTETALLTVINSQGRAFFGQSRISAYAPGLFTANATGQGVAAAVVQRVRQNGSSSFEPVARFDATQNQFVAVPIDLGPESDQVFLILFGTGIGNLNQTLAYGVNIGGADAQVLFAGAQGNLAGLDQVNVRLPRSLAGRGEADVVLTIYGTPANTVRVSLR